MCVPILTHPSEHGILGWSKQTGLQVPTDNLRPAVAGGLSGLSGSLFVWWSVCLGDAHTFDEWKDRLPWPQWVWGCSAVHALPVEVGARKRGCIVREGPAFQYQGHREERLVPLGL